MPWQVGSDHTVLALERRQIRQLQSWESQVQPCKSITSLPVPTSVAKSFAVDLVAA